MGSVQKQNTEKDRYSVSTYEFKDFSSDKNKDKVQEYNFHDFSQEKKEVTAEQVKQVSLEKDVAFDSGFAISPLVRQYRGHNKVDNLQKEQRIHEEVERRLLGIKDKSYQDGYNQGLEVGKKEVFELLMQSTDEKLQRISEMVENVVSHQSKIIKKQKDEMYRLIKNLTKWILLKEISSDKDYIQRLMEKLISEIESRNNFLIQVNAKQFEAMPEILGFVQDKFGKLTNMRVEIDPGVKTHGLILETENGILNATIEEQFKSLDKLFETVLSND